MRDEENSYRSAREELMAELREHFAADGLGDGAVSNRMSVAEEVLAAMADIGYLLVDGFTYRVANFSRDAGGATIDRWTIYTDKYEEDA